MKKAVLGVLGCALAAQASAWHTGLLTIPIADILGHREVYSSYTATGYERHIDKKIYHFAGFQVGLFDRLEIGADTDLEGWTGLNAKLLLVEPEDGRYALSAGIRNWEKGWSEPYLVGRVDFSNFRAHAGVMDAGSEVVFLGADFPIGEATGLVEWTSGAANYFWGGIDFALPKLDGFTVTLSIGIPNKKSNGTSGMASLNYGFRF